jgi:hypothetical protein
VIVYRKYTWWRQNDFNVHVLPGKDGHLRIVPVPGVHALSGMVGGFQVSRIPGGHDGTVWRAAPLSIAVQLSTRVPAKAATAGT